MNIGKLFRSWCWLCLLFSLLFACSSKATIWVGPFVPGPQVPDDCIGHYISFVTLTDPSTGSVWWTNYVAGNVTAHVTGYNDIGIKALRKRDLVTYCSPTNSLTISNSAVGTAYKFVVYLKSELPPDALVYFSLETPRPPQPSFSIAAIYPPDPTFPYTTNSIVTFWTSNTVPGIWYQFYYSQTLKPINDPSWIPHVAWLGQQNFVWQPAHVTTNRPSGFWYMKVINFADYHYDSSIWTEDVDPPIGYPPMPEPCTNCPPGDPQPPIPGD